MRSSRLTSSSNRKRNPVPCPKFRHVECVHARGHKEHDSEGDGCRKRRVIVIELKLSRHLYEEDRVFWRVDCFTSVLAIELECRRVFATELQGRREFEVQAEEERRKTKAVGGKKRRERIGSEAGAEQWLPAALVYNRLLPKKEIDGLSLSQIYRYISWTIWKIEYPPFTLI